MRLEMSGGTATVHVTSAAANPYGAIDCSNPQTA
jgi:hypothetical protein